MSEISTPPQPAKEESIYEKINRENQENILEINEAERLRILKSISDNIPTDIIEGKPTPESLYKLQIEALSKILRSFSQPAIEFPEFKLPENPEIIKSFPIPLIVSPNLPISIQIKGFDDDIKEHGSNVDNLHSVYDFIPQKPYIVWANDGSKFSGKTIEEARKMLSRNERFATFSEALSLYRADVGLFFRNRPLYHASAHSIGVGGTLDNETPVTIYHNYFNLQKRGEFQVDAFSNNKPALGWPTVFDSKFNQ